jgi:HK97 family phage major capsid protein
MPILESTTEPLERRARRERDAAAFRGYPGGTEDLFRRYVAAAAEYDSVAAAVRAASSSTPPAELRRLEEELEDAAAEVERCQNNIAAASRRAEIPEAERRRPEPVARGSLRHELTYRPDTPEVSFFRDAWRAQTSADPLAAERLARNAREQADEIRNRYGEGASFRDVGTSAFSGLTVPQYLVDLVAPLARAGAPLLNALPMKLRLPEEGMSLFISRITTGADVAAQASENAAVAEADLDDTLLEVPVRTYAGQQDVSRQTLERTDADRVIYADLARAYFTTLDSEVISGTGSSGRHLGIRNTSGVLTVSYNDASPTPAELWGPLNNALSQIESGVFQGPSALVMHPRRWRWLTAALDANSRPLVLPDVNGPFNALAVGDSPQYGGVAGTLAGVPVVTDANIPTNLGAGSNEDVILVLVSAQLMVWAESGDLAPRELRFEQVAPPQSIRLAVWGCSAFTAGRYPAASAVIGGTGLVAPTF